MPHYYYMMCDELMDFGFRGIDSSDDRSRELDSVCPETANVIIHILINLMWLLVPRATISKFQMQNKN